MKLKIESLLYFSIIFSAFCLQFDYLVTMSMEKFYGEVFYSHLEANILVQTTRNINVILIPLIILTVIYILYKIIYSIVLNKDKVYIPVECIFISQFILIGTIHFLSGLSWYIYGWF